MSLSSLLVQIVRFARKTCDPRNTERFAHNLQTLRQLCDRLTAGDLRIPADVLDRRPSSGRPPFDAPFVERPAPCTYISVLDDDRLTISVFVLHAGHAMPLHDHPRMHGILKPIHGRGTLESFTAVRRATVGDAGPAADWPLVRRESTAELRADVPALLLTPAHGNFHRIRADAERPVAFFDILCPPYRPGHTDCTYYAERPPAEPSENGELLQLRPVRCPETFWCDERFVLDDAARSRLLADDEPAFC